MKWPVALVACVLALQLSVGALERKEVFARLTQIPVFTLVNNQGSPVLVSRKNDPSKAQYATFFFQPQDAERFQTMMQGSNPGLAKSVKLRAIPLSLALQFSDDQKNKKPPVRIDLIPRETSMDYALTLAKQIDKSVKQFQGVPVFALTDLKARQVISVRRDPSNQPSQLYFFDESDAKSFFETLKRSNPKLAKETRISAAPLENLLAGMLKIQKPAEADQLVLIGSSASVKYAQKLQPTKP